MDIKPSSEVQTNQQPTVATPEVTAGLPPQGPIASTNSSAIKRGKRLGNKKVLLILVIALVFLGTGSAAAYIGLVQNNPSNVWKKSLERTSQGFKTLVDENKNSTAKNSKFDGSFKLEGPVAADGTISGSSSEKQSQLKVDLGASGVRASAELRAMMVDGSKNPDIYLNVSGLKAVAALAGPTYGEIINQIDGKWYVIDHTLLDQAAQSSQQGTSSGVELSVADVNLVLEKVQSVMSERVFTVDKTKAIFVVKENLGKEDFEGTNTYKYKVGIQKQQMKDFATALKDALKETKVKDLVLSTASGKTFEEAFDYENMLKEIDKLEDSDTVEVWAAIDGKFIRNIRFTDSANSKNILDIGLEKLGETLPMYIKVTGDDETGKGTMKLTVDYNQKTLAAKVGINLDGTFSNQTMKFNMTLNVQPTSEDVKIEKPSGATNAMELLGSFLGGASLGDTMPAGDNTSLLQECTQAYQDWVDAGGTTALPEECSQLDSL